MVHSNLAAVSDEFLVTAVPGKHLAGRVQVFCT